MRFCPVPAERLVMRQTFVPVAFCLFLVWTMGITPAFAADEKKPKLELKDGDRVVFIGNTFIEREQQHGYIETALTIAHPDKHIIVPQPRLVGRQRMG